ncbi:pyridoxamine 5'-phosphate oxidase family protein [soil metagenome]
MQRASLSFNYPFSEVIATEAQLREVLGAPGAGAVDKQLAILDRHSRNFIGRSPFAFVSSANAAGRCDVSPRGDGPGFVHVLDDQTLLIPDRPGNKRGDTLSNILENPHVGMLFLIPTVEETLRVNGRAAIVRDADLLERLAFRNKTPQFAIAVEVEEIYFHCAKAFKRAGLWDPEQWTGRGDLPTLGQILFDQIQPTDTTAESIECSIEEAYRTNLY